MSRCENLPPVDYSKYYVELITNVCPHCGSPFQPIKKDGTMADHESLESSRCIGSGLPFKEIKQYARLTQAEIKKIEKNGRYKDKFIHRIVILSSPSQ